ncbi:MAG: AIM24 family protein [Peptoniphilus sp. oral taxon 375]|nr:AIM24 family protein [Peptoniphilus sp. oral taxon 375]
MKYYIEGDNLPVVRFELEEGEGLISQAGGRAWMKGDIKTETISGGGVGKMLGRMFSGESLFLSSYKAKSPSEIVFASDFPGSIYALDLAEEQSIIAQKKAFLCADQGVDLSIYFRKKLGTGLFGGEGFIMQKITGPGKVFLEIDGHCQEYILNIGEKIVMDTGSLAMMDSTCEMSIEQVEGMKNILFGGEGLFNTVVEGPGKVLVQSMPIQKLARNIAPYLPMKG